MVERAGIELRCGSTTGTVLPDAGGVLVDLTIGGRAILASTPWAASVAPTADLAATEDAWVSRWMGGWQLCAPTAGIADPAATPRQGFHGAASSTPWSVLDARPSAIRLRWCDDGTTIDRGITLQPNGALATSRLTNTGQHPALILIAEHLILGAAVLEHEWHVVPGIGTRIRELDYNGSPTGGEWAWPGPDQDAWSHVHPATPARVAGLVDVGGAIALEGVAGRILVSWDGVTLPHALLWQELKQTQEPPWHGSVAALGIEPTTAPTGEGTASGEAVSLAPGERLDWSTELSVEWSDQ